MGKRSSKFKIINNVLVGTTSLLLLGWVVFRILFPVFHFIYGQNIDDQFTTIGIEGKKYLEIKIADNYPFYKFSLKLSSSDDKPKEDIFGQVYQNEVGLYPIKKTITRQSELLDYLIISNDENIFNGELVSKNDAVYFLSDKQYRAFLNANIFNKLGFDWDKVKKNINLNIDSLSKGESIDENVAYLTDSFVQIKDNLYLIDGKTRVKIDSQELEKFIQDRFSVIKIKSNRLLPVGDMFCTKMVFNKKTKCTFIRNGNQIFSKAKIIIEQLDDSFSIKSGSASIDTFDSFSNSVVPQITIFNIKNSIKSNYGDSIAKLGIKFNSN